MPPRNATGKRRRRQLARTRKDTDVTIPGDGTPTAEEWQRMVRIGSFIVDVYEEQNLDDEDEDELENETHSTYTTDSGSHLVSNAIKFRKGDDVTLHSEMDETDDIWVGRIQGIRKRTDEDEVWVKVSWYWSGQDVSKYLGNKFNPAECSPRERLACDYLDFVSARSFLAVTHVHEYDERELDPPDIGPNDYFVRAEMLYWSRKIKPELGSETCICKRSYVLFPPANEHNSESAKRTARPKYAYSDASSNSILMSSPTDDRMHFCPRASRLCRRWYHVSCLMKHGKLDTPSVPYYGDRGVRLLAVNPDREEDCALLAWFSTPIAELDGDEERHDENENDSKQSSPSPVPPVTPRTPPLSLSAALKHMSTRPEILSHLPPALVQIAQYPIVRRPGPPQEGWSAVGNVTEVVLARRFVYAAFEGGHPGGRLSQHLTHLVGLVEAMERGEMLTDVVVPGEEGNGASSSANLDQLSREDSEIMMLENLCVELAQYSLLASPYEPYWQRRQEELKEETRMNGPPLICPGCRGAI